MPFDTLQVFSHAVHIVTFVQVRYSFASKNTLIAVILLSGSDALADTYSDVRNVSPLFGRLMVITGALWSSPVDGVGVAVGAYTGVLVGIGVWVGGTGVPETGALVAVGCVGFMVMVLPALDSE